MISIESGRKLDNVRDFECNACWWKWKKKYAQLQIVRPILSLDDGKICYN